MLPVFLAAGQNISQDMPRLYSSNGHTTLLVDNRPFIMLGGELGNSSASDSRYMAPIWPKLKKMHLNTLVAPFIGSCWSHRKESSISL